jgi:hypothetical protein
VNNRDKIMLKVAAAEAPEGYEKVTDLKDYIGAADSMVRDSSKGVPVALVGQALTGAGLGVAAGSGLGYALNKGDDAATVGGGILGGLAGGLATLMIAAAGASAGEKAAKQPTTNIKPQSWKHYLNPYAMMKNYTAGKTRGYRIQDQLWSSMQDPYCDLLRTHNAHNYSIPGSNMLDLVRSYIDINNSITNDQDITGKLEPFYDKLMKEREYLSKYTADKKTKGQ